MTTDDTPKPRHCTCRYSRDAEGEHRFTDPECPIHGGRTRTPETR